MFIVFVVFTAISGVYSVCGVLQLYLVFIVFVVFTVISGVYSVCGVYSYIWCL